jgi:hypothetical protein
VITRAARLWQDVDGDWRWHLDLYYPERVERWISRQASAKSVGFDAGVVLDATSSRGLNGCAEWGRSPSLGLDGEA